MQDGAPVGVIDRVDDLERRAVGKREMTAIAGLAAAARVKHRRVQRDASGRSGDHVRFSLAPIGVVAEDQRRGHRKTFGAVA